MWNKIHTAISIFRCLNYILYATVRVGHRFVGGAECAVTATNNRNSEQGSDLTSHIRNHKLCERNHDVYDLTLLPQESPTLSLSVCV